MTLKDPKTVLLNDLVFGNVEKRFVTSRMQRIIMQVVLVFQDAGNMRPTVFDFVENYAIRLKWSNTTFLKNRADDRIYFSGVGVKTCAAIQETLDKEFGCRLVVVDERSAEVRRRTPINL